MDSSDGKLIKQYLAGDEEAFETLLKRYLRPAFHFILSLVKEKESAEDILQIATLKAWGNLRHFDSQKSFKAWFFTIAKNSAYDFLKKKKSVPFSSFTNEEGESVLEEVKDDSLLPEEILEREEVKDEMAAFLADLPKEQERVLTLFYREDFTLQEIAGILGEPYNTVKSRHFRGIQALRKAFLGPDAPKVARKS